jgi:hypothetical protein
MDRRERKILEDQIDQGTLDVGIKKIEETAAEEEKRLPAWKGVKWGMVAGLAAAMLYINAHSPLGFYVGNITLVLLGGIGAGGAIGALVMWLLSKRPLMKKKPPQ